jgi:hypothetical protein
MRIPAASRRALGWTGAKGISAVMSALASSSAMAGSAASRTEEPIR